jgi:amino acid transporter
MKKTVLTFGLISGAISAALMLATVPFIDKIGFDKGLLVGYSAMILAFLLVFFGVRSYRDNVTEGQISFGRAFGVGLLITVISCICYVITWEIVYFNFMPDFAEKYGAYTLEKMRNSGATAQQVAQQVESLKSFKALYDNPFYNVLMTFTEPLPVGLLVTLISAIVLRKKQKRLNGEQQLASS